MRNPNMFPARQEPQLPNFNGYIYQFVILLFYIMSQWIDPKNEAGPVLEAIQRILYSLITDHAGIKLQHILTAQETIMMLNGIFILLNIYPKGRDPVNLTRDISLFAILTGLHILIWFVLKDIGPELVVATIAMIVALFTKLRINYSWSIYPQRQGNMYG